MLILSSYAKCLVYYDYNSALFVVYTHFNEHPSEKKKCVVYILSFTISLGS